MWEGLSSNQSQWGKDVPSDRDSHLTHLHYARLVWTLSWAWVLCVCTFCADGICEGGWGECMAGGGLRGGGGGCGGAWGRGWDCWWCWDCICCWNCCWAAAAAATVAELSTPWGRDWLACSWRFCRLCCIRPCCRRPWGEEQEKSIQIDKL